MIAFDDMSIHSDYVKYSMHHIFLPAQDYPFLCRWYDVQDIGQQFHHPMIEDDQER